MGANFGTSVRVTHYCNIIIWLIGIMHPLNNISMSYVHGAIPLVFFFLKKNDWIFRKRIGHVQEKRNSISLSIEPSPYILSLVFYIFMPGSGIWDLGQYRFSTI
ncbi:hypothetical protein ACJX0J_011905 [Zea mays]